MNSTEGYKGKIDGQTSSYTSGDVQITVLTWSHLKFEKKLMIDNEENEL